MSLYIGNKPATLGVDGRVTLPKQFRDEDVLYLWYDPTKKAVYCFPHSELIKLADDLRIPEDSQHFEQRVIGSEGRISLEGFPLSRELIISGKIIWKKRGANYLEIMSK